MHSFNHRPLNSNAADYLKYCTEIKSKPYLRDLISNAAEGQRNNKNIKENDLRTEALRMFEEFCDKTSFHGLKFFGDPTLTFGERLFWLISFIFGLIFASYFIFNIYDKYNNSPVIISYNPSAVSLVSIPFPAITICSLNQATKKEALHILNTGSDTEKKILNDYCSSNNTFSNNSEEDDAIATNWKYMKNFITKLNLPCDRIIKVCRWRQQSVNCSLLFKTIFTDDGMCCAFNRIPLKYIFNDIVDDDEEQEELSVDWHPQKGFDQNAPLNATPWRPAGAGVNFGLTIVADNAIDNYYCSSTSSLGFKLLLSNPIESPKMADYGFLVSPGTESRVAIQPIMNDATDTLRDIDLSKRQCYFPDERYLLFFKIYTERNCRLECQANFTQESCDCIPYYLPRTASSHICGKKQEDCSGQAKDVMETLRLNGTNCNCLPGCFELSFAKTISYGKLTNKFKVKERILGNTDPNYFMENMAVIHFFFSETLFRKYTKSELFGFTEFLSNTGGLLGLFLGFSFLSLVEIMYYLSLKLICRKIQNRKKSHQNKLTQTVYPFLQ